MDEIRQITRNASKRKHYYRRDRPFFYKRGGYRPFKFYVYGLKRKDIDLSDKKTPRYYVGMRASRNSPEYDNYWGSGVHLPKGPRWRMFDKVILHTCDSWEEARDVEVDILRRYNAADSPLWYNAINDTDNYEKRFGRPPKNQHTYRRPRYREAGSSSPWAVIGLMGLGIFGLLALASCPG